MVEFINPASMFSNPAYSQAVIIPAGARTMLIGGQNAVAKDGSIVGVGDLAAQSKKAIENLIACLQTAGGDVTNLVQVTLYFKGDIDIMPGYMEWAKVWGKRANAPTVNAAKVLGSPGPTCWSRSAPSRFFRELNCIGRELRLYRACRQRLWR